MNFVYTTLACVFIGTIYRFRYRIVYKILKGVANVFVWVTFHTQSKDGVEYVGKEYTSNNFEVHRHKLIQDNKVHHLNVVVVDKNNESTLDYFDVVEYKNMIVYCSVDDIDITSDFREFAYHFDKQDASCQLKYFVEYIKMKHKVDGKEIMIYMNDDECTNVNYNIENIENLTFKEIMKLN